MEDNPVELIGKMYKIAKFLDIYPLPVQSLRTKKNEISPMCFLPSAVLTYRENSSRACAPPSAQVRVN